MRSGSTPAWSLEAIRGRGDWRARPRLRLIGGWFCCGHTKQVPSLATRCAAGAGRHVVRKLLVICCESGWKMVNGAALPGIPALRKRCGQAAARLATTAVDPRVCHDAHESSSSCTQLRHRKMNTATARQCYDAPPHSLWRSRSHCLLPHGRAGRAAHMASACTLPGQLHNASRHTRTPPCAALAQAQCVQWHPQRHAMPCRDRRITMVHVYT